MRTSLRLIPVILMLAALAGAAVAGPPPTPPDSTDQPLNLNLKNLHWDKMLPALGEGSPTMSILHKDPKSGATQLLVRVPKDFHVTPHWHSANETHTVVQGVFVMGCMGKQDTLREAGFNYVPARMVHEAWTTERLGATLLITVDGPWDVNFIADAPRPRSTERAAKAKK